MEKLTKRESEILELICLGFNNSEIGNKLEISNNTVKAHIKNIFAKYEVKNRTRLAYILGKYI